MQQVSHAAPARCLQVIVLWTANTERYSSVAEGLNDTADNFMAAIDRNEAEVAPSSLYAAACILEGVPFINGAPQNTFVPGLIDMAVKHNVLIGGDDFKSGQTKMKSVLVDFLVRAWGGCGSHAAFHPAVVGLHSRSTDTCILKLCSSAQSLHVSAVGL